MKLRARAWSISLLLVLGSLAAGQDASPRQERWSGFLDELYVATSAAPPGGSVFRARGFPPWFVRRLARTGASPLERPRMRVFRQALYVVDPGAGTVTRILRSSGERRVFDLGPESEPQDVLVVPPFAYVTRRHATELLRIDLATGETQPVVDLGPLACPDESVALGTLERDCGRLFVQVALTGGSPCAAPFFDRGVLGVIDLANLVLVDADDREPGVQGVRLSGAPPAHRMQILQRTLFVSTTDGFLDGRGGIEMVDLDRLRSVGYALSEEVIADLGGFVMTSAAGGYFVFHTDLTASTHLKPFTIAGGPAPGPEEIVFFDVIDNLAYDPELQRLYLPSGFDTFSGVFVLDTRTNEPVGDGRIPLSEAPQDVVVAPRFRR